jgi:hypothetical protein
MGRIPWKDGKVISIETRPGLFALGRMVRHYYIAFFNAFNDSPDWPDASLDEVPILHFAGIVNRFITQSNVKHQKHLQPAKLSPPQHWISPNSQAVIRTIWAGSANEVTVGYIGTKASLIDMMRYVVMPNIDPHDSATIDSHELNGLVDHPYQNERLYLCHLLGRNIDVNKDLVFGREVPVEYETFLRYIAMGGMSSR